MRYGLQRKSCLGARGSATVGNVAENVAPATLQGLPFRQRQPNREKGSPSTNERLPERGERRAWFRSPARLPVSMHASARGWTHGLASDGRSRLGGASTAPDSLASRSPRRRTAASMAPRAERGAS